MLHSSFPWDCFGGLWIELAYELDDLSKILLGLCIRKTEHEVLKKECDLLCCGNCLHSEYMATVSMSHAGPGPELRDAQGDQMGAKGYVGPAATPVQGMNQKIQWQ